MPTEIDAEQAAKQPTVREDAAALKARIAMLEAELAQVTQAQAALAYGISHDLRAPLRAIDGFAVQLARELDADEAAGQQVAKIRAAVGRMGVLTESLVEYARVARSAVRDEAVDLAFLVEWALMDLRAQYPEVQIKAEVQPDLWVQGDERLLRTLLDKLLDNSRKFAKPGQPMSVRVQGQQGEEGFHLSVSDEGIGMSLRDAAQPFEPFLRLHGNREGGGDGLGLSIAQAIVLKLGGKIWMESMPAEGSQVHIVLPAKGPDAAS